jgi:phenylacetate-coenzyme A ligase PaaK-like adenylate-forming protein
MEVTEKKGMNDRLKVLVEASPEILASKEERKTALQEAVQLALRRAIGLRVEVEIVAKDRVLEVGWRG